MKIIGTAGHSILMQMSKQEVAQVMGFHYECEIPNPGRYDERFEPGKEYNVSDIYKRLRRQEDVKAQLATAAKSLESLADLIRHVSPIADELTKQPEVSA